MRSTNKRDIFSYPNNKADSQQHGELVTRSPIRRSRESVLFICVRCHKEKTHEQRTKSHPCWCKDCNREYYRDWRKRNPNKVKQYRLKWRNKTAEYYRQWYNQFGRSRAVDYLEKSKAYIRNHRTEQNAGQTLRRAIYKGIVIPDEHCAICGLSRKLLAHHENYNQPLNVTWLCYSCHRKLHLGTL